MSNHPYDDAGVGPFPVHHAEQLTEHGRRWDSKADQVSHAADHRHAATSSVVGHHWKSNDAHRSGEHVSKLHGHSHHAASLLREGARVAHTAHDHLSDAHDRYRAGHQLGVEAQHEEDQHRQSGAALLASMSPAQRTSNPDAYHRALAQSDGSDGYVSPKRAQSVQNGHQALEEAHHTISTHSNRLHDIASQLHKLGSDIASEAKGLKDLSTASLGTLSGTGTWMTHAKYGQFAPRNAKGQFKSPKDLNTSQKARAVIDKDNWKAKPSMSDMRGKWLKLGKASDVGGAVLAGGTAFADQLSQDSKNKHLDGTAKAARATDAGVLTGAGAYAGAEMGADAGMAIGSLLPGPGTAIGGVVGGLVGAVIGSGIGQFAAKTTVHAVGKAADAVEHTASKAVKGAVHDLESIF